MTETNGFDCDVELENGKQVTTLRNIRRIPIIGEAIILKMNNEDSSRCINTAYQIIGVLHNPLTVSNFNDISDDFVEYDDTSVSPICTLIVTKNVSDVYASKNITEDKLIEIYHQSNLNTRINGVSKSEQSLSSRKDGNIRIQ